MGVNMQLNDGVVTGEEYQKLLNTSDFQEMKDFSDSFIERNRKILEPYSKKWVIDSFNQWSRRWEYPYVFSRISDYASGQDGDVRILDAGCGVSFFPYYLYRKLENFTYIGLDYDPEFKSILNQINENEESNVALEMGDIRNLGYSDNVFDCISCISVLEHSSEYPVIIKEFYRILKPGGKLILTFDISLDGFSDIPVAKANTLLRDLTDTFKQEEILLSLGDGVLTTYDFKEDDHLLPWRYPVLSAVKSAFKNRQVPKLKMKKLSCACYEFVK